MPTYSRAVGFGKLGSFIAELEQALKADAGRNKQDRGTGKALFVQIKASGYKGSYSRVTDYIRAWRTNAGKDIKAFVPLRFELGEAFQFDCSEEGMVIWGHLPVHAGLPHEAVRQSRLLVGGLPQRGSRNAV